MCICFGFPYSNSKLGTYVVSSPKVQEYSKVQINRKIPLKTPDKHLRALAKITCLFK